MAAIRHSNLNTRRFALFPSRPFPSHSPESRRISNCRVLNSTFNIVQHSKLNIQTFRLSPSHPPHKPRPLDFEPDPPEELVGPSRRCLDPTPVHFRGEGVELDHHHSSDALPSQLFRHDQLIETDGLLRHLHGQDGHELTHELSHQSRSEE